MNLMPGFPSRTVRPVASFADMHVTFALFADAANLSQEGKLNILGVFDALQVGTLPALHPRATLVVHLKGSVADAGTHRVSLRWLSPSGSELWSSEGELGVATPPSGVLDMDFPLIAQLDLPLDLAGGYLMRVGLDGETHAEVPLQVRSATAQPSGPTPTYLS
jgi:hypothetical protein